MDIIRKSALEVDWEKNHLPHRGLGSISVLHLAFWSDVLPAELSPPEKATPKPNKGKSYQILILERWFWADVFCYQCSSLVTVGM